MKNFKTFLLLTVLLLLMACNGQIIESQGETSQTPSVAVVTASSQETQDLPIFNTETVIDKTAYVQTITHSIKITSTPDISFTPLPTLSPNDAADLLRNLGKSNSSCKLPCWWGLIPGQSNWLVEKHFFESFATKITSEENKKTGSDGKDHYFGSHFLSFDLGKEENSILLITTEDNIITGIFPGHSLTKQGYELNNILKEFGTPTSVFINTYASVPEPPIPFRILVYYDDINVLFYFETTAEEVGDELIGCLTGINSRIRIWSPDKKMSNYSLQETALGSFPTHVLSIEQAVDNMSMEKFSSTYKEMACIKTQITKWK